MKNAHVYASKRGMWKFNQEYCWPAKKMQGPRYSNPALQSRLLLE